MDRIEFKIIKPYDKGEEWAVHYNYRDTYGTEILVNGKDVVALVNEKMGAQYHGHIEPRMVYYELKCAASDKTNEYEAHIGRCNDCGDIGCEPIVCPVHTSESENTVRWVVGNRYDSEMFEFIFDRAEYDKALAELRRLGLEHGEAKNAEKIKRDVELYYSSEQIGTLTDFLYMRGYSDEAIQTNFAGGKTCCFTGHRPKYFTKFCRCGEEMPDGLSEWLDERISYAAGELGVNKFVCGNAEGVDTWAARAVLRYRETHPDICLEIAVPFDGHNVHIPEITEIQRQADEVRIVAKSKNHTEAYFRRNEYMVDKSDVVLGVCIFYVDEVTNTKDMQKGGTRKTIEYAKKLGKKVYVKEYYKQINLK